MKGRKPKLAVVNGNPVTGLCPRAPDWLSAEARSEWDRAAPELYARNLLHPDTLATLEAYCVAAGQVRETEVIMAAEGRIMSTSEGPKPHPAFKMQGAAMREARLLAAELSLTPHRRGLKGKDESNKNDKWNDELLA